MELLDIFKHYNSNKDFKCVLLIDKSMISEFFEGLISRRPFIREQLI